MRYYIIIIVLLAFSSCRKYGPPTSRNPGSTSTTTGLAYNEEEGFEVQPYTGQPEGPNLVYVEGGRTVLGSYEEDLMKEHNNLERTVTVASFYMDETEIANIHWQEYLYFIKRDSAEEYLEAALPDTTVWTNSLSYNDPYVEHYFRYPGFRYFPVVGITWVQANDFARWRTAVVNSKLAEESGIEQPDPMDSTGGEVVQPSLQDGTMLPDYRLPTETEWEYAAQALVGNNWLDENQTHNRIYPWDGHTLRNPYGNYMGFFLCNFKRGRGDYAGIAGRLNDGAMITDYIYNYPPNDFGLYNMAGNVNEWVYDVYRPTSFQNMDDLNPIRRDGVLDEETGYDKHGFQSLIDNNARVFKGGSWNDVAYWCSPGTRRFIDQDSCTAHIGFRCAMYRLDTQY